MLRDEVISALIAQPQDSPVVVSLGDFCFNVMRLRFDQASSAIVLDASVEDLISHAPRKHGGTP